MSQLLSSDVSPECAPLSFNEPGKVLQRSPVRVTDATTHQIHSWLAPRGQAAVFQGVCISRTSEKLRDRPRVERRRGVSLGSGKGCFSSKSQYIAGKPQRDGGVGRSDGNWEADGPGGTKPGSEVQLHCYWSGWPCLSHPTVLVPPFPQCNREEWLSYGPYNNAS